MKKTCGGVVTTAVQPSAVAEASLVSRAIGEAEVGMCVVCEVSCGERSRKEVLCATETSGGNSADTKLAQLGGDLSVRVVCGA